MRTFLKVLAFFLLLLFLASVHFIVMFAWQTVAPGFDALLAKSLYYKALVASGIILCAFVYVVYRIFRLKRNN